MQLAMLAGLLGGELTDPAKGEAKVSNMGSLESAGPGDLAFLWDDRYMKAAEGSGAEAIVCKAPVEGKTCILVDDPEAAMLMLLGQVYGMRHPPIAAGVHPTAFVSPEATLGDDVAVGPGAVIEAGSKVGARSQIRGRAYVGRCVTLGEDTTLHPNATVLDHVRIGDRVTIWSGAIIGKDGFGFRQRAGKHVRIPQIGTVIIEDDVEVGALSTVARGAIDDTIIRKGVIIDDHCHVAHGCEIGENTVLVGRTAMGGSVKVGKGCFLLQDSGISTGISIGDGAVIGSCARVFYKDVPPGARVQIPANTHAPTLTKRIEATLPRLPEMRLRLKRLERQVEALTQGNPGD